jgi:hypothetical protein
MPPYRLALCNAPLLAFGDKVPFLLCVSQDTSFGHLFSESAQQVFRRFAVSQYDVCHLIFTSSGNWTLGVRIWVLVGIYRRSQQKRPGTLPPHRRWCRCQPGPRKNWIDVWKIEDRD